MQTPCSLTSACTLSCWVLLLGSAATGEEDRVDREAAERAPAPAPDERQLPRAMRSAMEELPRIRVGAREGDLIGGDHRALQAAVDYVAALGGGVVEIGEGTYEMRDSLHLRSRVTVRGRGEKTVLLKAPAAVSPLVLDGDFGEEQVTLADATGFQVGDGIAVWDSRAGGFHVVVARITGKSGKTVSLSRPLNADYMVHREARAATVFPVISGYDLEGARVENLTVDGNRDRNVHLTGCRGAGIFLYRGFETVLRNCVVRNYNGDGISFQQSNDVQVLDCISENNASLGLHPGSGSQRAVVRGCTARNNGSDGLFLCWRVRHGLFEKNVLVDNGRFGISIGHKDSDNLLRGNRVIRNGRHGIYFRNESYGMAGHRNRLVENLIEDNGSKSESAGIMVDGETNGIVIEGNTIRDTRSAESRTQRTGIRIGERSGSISLGKNEIDAETEVDDRRPGR